MIKDPASEFVYVRTYSKWIDELKRRETWPETVKRYIDFIVEERGKDVPQKVIRKIEEKMLAFEVMPSMRALWAAGPAAKFDNTTLYNCSYAHIDSPESFAEALYILMCGTGDGYSVQQKWIINNKKLPIVPIFDSISDTPELFVVGDTKAGWADSIKFLMETYYKGKNVNFDYSKLRPKGARLKTMGGRSSGPEPLIVLHHFIAETFSNAQGRQLTTLELSDIRNQIAETVVVGGVRRSSQICFSDLGDELLQKAKVWPFPQRRSMANHSAIYDKKPTAVEFLKEWATLASSGTGERGISNLEIAQLNAPKRRKSELIEGSNPCVPGYVEILTSEGYQSIKDLVNKKILVWNGFEWSEVEPKETGQNRELVKVELSSGQSLICTKNHKFVLSRDYKGSEERIEAEHLQIGDKLIKSEYPILDNMNDVPYAYAQGFQSAEGMDGYKWFYVYYPKQMCIKRLNPKRVKDEPKTERHRVFHNFDPHPKNFVPFDWSMQSKLDWLAGLIDGDGTELKEGGTQVGSVDKDFLLNTQKLLTTMGVASKVTPCMKPGLRSLPNHKGGYSDYYCQQSYRLLIGAVQIQFLKSKGLKCERLQFNKTPQRDASQFVKVISVEDWGIADKVYCFTEPKRNLGCFNGVVTGQCHEISLRNKQFCNLSEVVIRAEDDLDSLLEKVETATWIGVIQSSFTYFPYLSKEWKKNCEEERLLGVSLTGQMDNPDLLTTDALKALKARAIKVAKHASQKMGINMPTAITCVKPSGTVSQLVNSASGVHPRYAQYYIRRYRIAATDPLFKLIRDQGVEVKPENGQENLKIEDVNTWVVSFPVKAPEGCITRDKMTAIEQLEWYKKIQTNWCEHNASMTVYVKDHEWFEVGNWVYKNWDVVNGVSFLPYDGGRYKQAPYEEITEDQYKKLVAKMPKIDYTKLSEYELEDNTEGAKSYNCTGDRCEIV